jgi:glutathione reductase (NADPH)
MQFSLAQRCVNVGCVPKKLMVYGSHFPHDAHDAKGYGWDVAEPKLDWKRFIENKNKEIARLNGIYERMLGNSGVELIKKKATLVDAHTVDVEGKKITADKILVAVGGWPMVPEFPGSENVISSNEAFFLPECPKRVIVVGGGYIAIEFAAIFNGYGSKVTQLYRGDMWLRGFDMDVRKHLIPEYETIGVDVKFNANIAKIDKQGDGSLKATLEDGSTLEADVIMYATGRVPRTKGLGCEEAGVKLDKNGAIIVDEGFQTSVPSIYAVGDVINRIQLTPVALAEGHCLADTIFGNKPRKTDYSDVPTAVFSQPPVGTVGLTEEQAREKHGNDKIHIYRTSFRAMKHTISGRQEKTLMKLVVHAETDKVLGVHMVGDAAGEIIQLAGVCIKAGTTKAHWDSTIGVHPTSAEEFVTLRTRVPDDQL